MKALWQKRKESSLTVVVVEDCWNVLDGEDISAVTRQHARFADVAVADYDALDGPTPTRFRPS